MSRDIFDLKNFRTTIGWTQKELAEKVGVSQSTINAWENNPGNIPYSGMYDIADVTGYKMMDLLSFGEKQTLSAPPFTIDDTSTQKRKALVDTYSDMKEVIENYRDAALSYPEYHKALSELEVLLESAVMEGRKLDVAFLGKSDAGKSTMINSLLGKEISPSQWQPATSAVIKIVHIEDKPSQLKDDDTIIVRLPKEEELVTLSQLENQAFFEKYVIASGDVSLIKEYGLHDQEEDLDEGTMDTIITYVEATILKAMNIIDTPGIATGEHTRGRKDTIASENTRQEADAVVYLSVANQFLHAEDQLYLKAILDILPPVDLQVTDQPFSNLFIVASQAHITGQVELEKPDGIYDKALANFLSILPDNYLESRNENYKQEDLRARFFSFSRDETDLSQAFRDAFTAFIERYSKGHADLLEEKYDKLLTAFIEDYDDVVLKLFQEADDLSGVKLDLKRKKAERAEKYDEMTSFVEETKKVTKKYEKKTQEEILIEYEKIMNVDYITQLIEERSFKNRKEDKERIQNLLSNILNESIQDINEKYSKEFKEFLDGQLETYQKSFKAVNFDFKRSFISILAGGAAGGALMFYMASLGNLGGYILVTKIVGLLATLGISVGGGAAATTFIASIGGPVVLAAGLGLLATTAIFKVTGVGWKTPFAKKLVKAYEKENVRGEIDEKVSEFWKETRQSMDVTGRRLKETYDEEIERLEVKLERSPEYFFITANKIKELNDEVKRWLEN